MSWDATLVRTTGLMGRADELLPLGTLASVKRELLAVWPNLVWRSSLRGSAGDAGGGIAISIKTQEATNAFEAIHGNEANPRTPTSEEAGVYSQRQAKSDERVMGIFVEIRGSCQLIETLFELCRRNGWTVRDHQTDHLLQPNQQAEAHNSWRAFEALKDSLVSERTLLD